MATTNTTMTPEEIAESLEYLNREVALAARIWYRDGNSGRLRYVVRVREEFEEKHKSE